MNHMKTIKETTRKPLEFFGMERLTAKDMLRAFYFSLSLMNVIITGGIGSSWALMASLIVFTRATRRFLKIGRNPRDE